MMANKSLAPGELSLTGTMTITIRYLTKVAHGISHSIQLKNPGNIDIPVDTMCAALLAFNHSRKFNHQEAGVP